MIEAIKDVAVNPFFSLSGWALTLVGTVFGVWSELSKRQLRHQGSRLRNLVEENDTLLSRDFKTHLDDYRKGASEPGGLGAAVLKLLAGIAPIEALYREVALEVAHSSIGTSEGTKQVNIDRAMHYARLADCIVSDGASARLVAVTKLLDGVAATGEQDRIENARLVSLLFAGGHEAGAFDKFVFGLLLRAMLLLDGKKDLPLALELSEAALYAAILQHGSGSPVVDLACLVRDTCALANGKVSETFARNVPALGIDPGLASAWLEDQRSDGGMNDTAPAEFNMAKELDDIILGQMVLIARTSMVADLDAAIAKARDASHGPEAERLSARD